jgi:hypothetical protein
MKFYQRGSLAVVASVVGASAFVRRPLWSLPLATSRFGRVTVTVPFEGRKERE